MRFVNNMSNQESNYIDIINEFSINGDTSEIIRLLNEFLSEDDYFEHLELIFIMISMTQMYGFSQYFNEEEKKRFLLWDSLRCESYSGNNIEYLNSGQLSLLYEFDKNQKVFLSAPTSFGKTTIVIEHIIRNYNFFNNVLFIVPTNSLLEEIFMKLIKLNGEHNMNYKVTTQTIFRIGERNLTILTPERFLLLCEETSVNQYDLIVMDEAYKIIEPKNKDVSDFINDRSLRFRKVADIIGSTNHRLILLSPFTYDLSKSMGNYLNRFGIKKIDKKLEYVNREIIQMYLKESFNQVFPEANSQYLSSYTIPQKVNSILSNLIGQKTIVYVSNYKVGYSIVNNMKKNGNVNKDQRYRFFIEHLISNYTIKNINNEWTIISALKKGVGIYISPLPRYIKREIIDLYNRNILNTLIVTTAFTEGVNTNASNLIFTSLSNGPTTNKLTDIDILNIEGRAGRFAKNSIGKIYCISKEIYNIVKEKQNNAHILLENINYSKSVDGLEKSQYEVDMMEEEFLNEEEKQMKNAINLAFESFNISKDELNISLNVPNEWKLILFLYFSKLGIDELKILYENSVNLLDENAEKRCKSLEIIFDSIRKAFENKEQNPFDSKEYGIKAYSTGINKEFIWGRLYRIYSSGKISEIISRNIKFITNKFKEQCEKNGFTSISKINENVKNIFKNDKLEWILKYYNNDATLNFNAFYSETFKFISNIIQYKIPFFTSFYVSILKLFLSKKNGNYKFDLQKLSAKEVSIMFENGGNGGEYNQLIDYGISNDLILVLKENGITFNQLLNEEYERNLFDNYQLLTINDFLKIIR